jgi:hypothetical protein
MTSTPLKGPVPIVSALMALLFVAGVVVQVNDPDPLPWMAIYGAAAAVAVMPAVRGSVPVAAPLAVGIVALGWGAAVVIGGPTVDAYGRMFDAWEMDSAATEVAREGTGLFLIAAWMAVLTWMSWRERKKGVGTHFSPPGRAAGGSASRHCRLRH